MHLDPWGKIMSYGLDHSNSFNPPTRPKSSTGFLATTIVASNNRNSAPSQRDRASTGDGSALREFLTSAIGQDGLQERSEEHPPTDLARLQTHHPACGATFTHGRNYRCQSCRRYAYATSRGLIVMQSTVDNNASVRDTLLGLVHVVDDDAAFRAAMGRRSAPVGVATYPSALHCWSACRPKVCRAASYSTCGYRDGAVRNCKGG